MSENWIHKHPWHDHFKHMILLSLMVMLLVFSNAWAADTADIQMLSNATVSGKSVRLMDVSQIQHRDKRLVDRLGRIKIVEAPLPGKTRWVNSRQLQNAMTRSGIDLSRYRISDHGPTKVKRLAVKITAQKIQQAVKHYIAQNAPWKSDQMKIREIRSAHDLTVARGSLVIKVQSPKHTDWLGSIPFTVLIVVNGDVVKKVTVAAFIEVWNDVVLAAKPLGKYQTIESHHIRVVKMNLARVPANAILDRKQVLGSRTNRNIAANCILRNDQIELPPIIKRGDVIQVVAESRHMKISLQALAKENGAKGELIRVQNIRSKKTIYAQVVDGQTVQVDF